MCVRDASASVCVCVLPLLPLSLCKWLWPVCMAQRGWQRGRWPPQPLWSSWTQKRAWGASPEGQTSHAPEEGASALRTATRVESAWGTHTAYWLLSDLQEITHTHIVKESHNQYWYAQICQRWLCHCTNHTKNCMTDNALFLHPLWRA